MPTKQRQRWLFTDNDKPTMAIIYADTYNLLYDYNDTDNNKQILLYRYTDNDEYTDASTTTMMSNDDDADNDNRIYAYRVIWWYRTIGNTDQSVNFNPSN